MSSSVEHSGLEKGGSAALQHQVGNFLQAVDFGQDEAWIKSLSADELKRHQGNFYHYYYLNLLSILGGKLPLEQIRNLAVESTRGTLLGVREYLLSLSQVGELDHHAEMETAEAYERSLIKLRGWNLDLIRSLLQRGKGLILCSHHIGPFMFIPHELALQGFKVSLIIDAITFNESRPRLEFVKHQLPAESGDFPAHHEGPAAAANIHRLNILNAQEKESFVSLLKALERGECIFIYVDGNTGWDGVWGNSAKSSLDFLGFPIAVKNGVARLSAASGTPVLPLVTIRNETSFGELIFGAPIIPPAKMTPQERDEFVLQSMKSIYRLLEENALKFIDQWSSSCFLHRWRIPPAPSVNALPAPHETAEIERLLSTGRRFKVNEERIAELKMKNETAFMDVQTLKTYKAPQGLGDLFHLLAHEDGLGHSDISALNGGPQGRQRILSLLAYLKKLDVITSG